MGACNAIIQEVRFIIETELTQCYILIRAEGDCPLGVQGWHHKTFPASVNCLEILKREEEGSENHLEWSLEAPPA